MADKPLLLVAFALNDKARATVAEALNGTADVVCLPDIPQDQRQATLRRATALLAWNLNDIPPEDRTALANSKLIQFMTAGVDFLPLSTLPPNVPVAANGGAYAEPMAEHALAMALAAAKRLVTEHNAVAAGQFNQHTPNRMLAGGVCGILGYGGIGAATARLFRAIGLSVHGINRSGRNMEGLDWSGTTAQLDELLAASDVLIISVPLTRATHNLLGTRELGLMKPDATLINLARGEIIDEAALFAHLQAHPKFTACLDAWWIEPVRHGAFRMDHPFTSLPNVIASPHNSASVPAYRLSALRNAATNCTRAIAGEPIHYLAGPDERLL